MILPFLAVCVTGAGKTTLLNFLAHRLAGCGNVHRTKEEKSNNNQNKSSNDEIGQDEIPSGYHVDGSIRVNGQEVTSKFFTRV